MSRYDGIVTDFHRHQCRDPNARVYLGIQEDLGELPDPSLEDQLERLAEAQGLTERILDMGDQSLDFDERLDLDLAQLTLRSEILSDTVEYNGLTNLEQLPDVGSAVGSGLHGLFVSDPRPARARLDDILERLRQVPDYTAGLLRRLQRPVRRWAEVDAAKVAGLPRLLESIEAWAAHVDYPRLDALTDARLRAEHALHDYRTRLATMPMNTDFHIGEDAARKLVGLRGIELTLEELHRIAGDFLSDNRDAVETLRGRLAQKYDLPADSSALQVQDHLAERYAVTLPNDSLDDVLVRYRAERDRILEFIEARDLFPLFDAQDMKILRTPEFLEPSIPAGAMQAPAPFREGVRTSIIYLTLSRELLPEHTELGIPGMMIHEGIPGHHLQLAWASMHPSVIRRHFSGNDLAEGWTTMLEDYMLDQGYMGELTDEARFIGKLDIARIGARVAIDLFFMTGERRYLDVGVTVDPEHGSLNDPDPFGAAGALLKQVTGFTEARLQGELNWYSVERGYPLSYLTGNHLVWQLKRQVAEAQTGELEGLALDRAFHRAYLEAGNMPVSYLRRVFYDLGLL
ncbi:MAG: DUF885 domain-containing protein [Alphaproteobacteria bacterium]|nr:DUF885 domain-containing protein [Alphaproteobacteria bacterium]